MHAQIFSGDRRSGFEHPHVCVQAPNALARLHIYTDMSERFCPMHYVPKSHVLTHFIANILKTVYLINLKNGLILCTWMVHCVYQGKNFKNKVYFNS